MRKRRIGQLERKTEMGRKQRGWKREGDERWEKTGGEKEQKNGGERKE